MFLQAETQRWIMKATRWHANAAFEFDEFFPDRYSPQ